MSYKKLPPDPQNLVQQEQTVMGIFSDFKRNWEEDKGEKESSNKYKKPIFTVNDM